MHTGLKLYFDTSVISAYFDSNNKERQIITQKWFETEFDNFECYISELVIEELGNTSNFEKRMNMLALIKEYRFNELHIDKEVVKLSERYRERSLILMNEKSDSIHIACATYFNVNNIVSWNFKHFVNYKVIKQIHEVNLELNYKITEIFSLENLGGTLWIKN